ncbi:ribose 5-phosphate isomerase B [Candidatus Bandiella euplotis]|nr:ribose 5-phosphate isomerase B [Candidatus Bandiella woodruffii]
MKKKNKIGIASDHAGYELKRELLCYLEETVVDYGTYNDEPVDYPDLAAELVKDIELGQINYGILICGSGIGMSICANRNKFARAALCYSMEAAKLAREHNDANILVLGARFTPFEDSKNILDIFLNTKFDGGRHLRRIKKYSASNL